MLSKRHQTFFAKLKDLLEAYQVHIYGKPHYESTYPVDWDAHVVFVMDNDENNPDCLITLEDFSEDTKYLYEEGDYKPQTPPRYPDEVEPKEYELGKKIKLK
jgi:hypothetical protein